MEKFDMSCKENMVPLKTIEPSKRRTIKLQTFFFFAKGHKRTEDDWLNVSSRVKGLLKWYN